MAEKRLRKTFKLGKIEGFESTCGTYNRENPITLFLDARAWITPFDGELYRESKETLQKRLKKALERVPSFLMDKFSKECISDIDFSDASLMKGERCFCILTLFLKQNKDSVRKVGETVDDMGSLSREILSCVKKEFALSGIDIC